MRNLELARLLYELADLSDYVGDSPYKSRAYRRAAHLLETMQVPIESLAEQGKATLSALPGIGDAIADKILTYLQTGTIPKHQQLRQQVPSGVLEVMRVPGIGPKIARILNERLGVNDLESLQKVLLSDAVRALPHFGETKSRRLLQMVDLVKKSRLRRPLGTVYWLGQERLEWLRGVSGVQRAMLGGSVRRMQESVGDLDYLVATEHPEKVVAAFVRMSGVEAVFAQGVNRAQVFIEGGLQVDLRTVPPARWGAGMLYITGSKSHSIRLREIALERGLKLNEYGVWSGTECVASETEAAVYEALGLVWIPPTLREDTGEIELARARALPVLVERRQIQGDLQTHSRWSDGEDTIEALALAAIQQGYTYIAITDHVEMLAWQGDVWTLFHQRQQEIAQINERFAGQIYLLNGLEVNIDLEGRLDAPEALLKEAEIVLAGVHYGHGQESEAMTKRLLRALEHPYVHILAHPTGRRFGKREPNDADWERIFQRAWTLGKAIEVNGYTTRMDPPTPLVRLLEQSGAWIALGTDSHCASDLRMMELAVGLAQRGWVSGEQVLNTRPLPELLGWLKEVRT